MILVSIYLERLARKNAFVAKISRKILHILAGSFAIIALDLSVDKKYLIYIACFAFILSAFAIWKKYFSQLENLGRKSWGIALFPLGYLFLMLVSDQNDLFYAKISMLILTFSDSSAAIMGENFEYGSYHISKDRKTVSGSLAFFFFTIFLISTSLFFFQEFKYSKFNGIYLVLSVSLIAFILTLIEAASFNGFDNFFIPFFSFFLVKHFLSFENYELLKSFYLGLIYGGAISYISYKAKFLTFGGAVGAFLLAIFIFGIGGFKWAVPILTFFFFSSLLSLIRKRYKFEIENNFYEKSSRRDFYQAMANGGVGLFLSIAYLNFSQEKYYLAFVLSVASACADTWATEFGSSFKTKVYNILTFKETKQGTSGGVSLIGFVGSFLGASLVVASTIPFVDFISTEIFMILVSFAILSTVVDSVLGASVQARYKCHSCGILTEKLEHCSKPTALYKGLNFINNDAVNFISVLFSSCLFLFFSDSFL